MRLIKYYIYTFIFIICVFYAGYAIAARLSDENGITSSSQNTKAANQQLKTNRNVISKTGAKTGKKTPALKGKDSRLVTIDYDNVDITILIKFISDLTGKNFVFGSKVKGKTTIISPTKLSVDEAYMVFQSALEVIGFTTIPSGSSIKIVSAKDARSKNIETRFGDDRINPEDRVVTQIIPLKYASPRELKKVLDTFKSTGSMIYSYEPTGVLIVTDVLSNISRILKIIAKIDIPGTGEEIKVHPLKHASAQTMAASLDKVFKTVAKTAKKSTIASSQMIIVPDERTNSLIIVASEVDTLKILELVDLLDQDIPRGGGDIHVYYLQNADAEELSKTLMSIPKNNNQKVQKGTAPGLSKDIQIVADKATNALIITAGRSDYVILENVIQKLDRPRSMVYIEALVMEVSMTNEFELGVQWQGGTSEDGTVIYGASNPGANNFPSLETDGSISFPRGLSLGVIGDTITIGGIEFPSIKAVVRAYATDSDVQILSTPQLMIIDNVEGEINVTNRVPYITRSDESDSGRNYSNYDFKDVGVKLKITPQINQERFVRLKIDQEVSQILSTDETGQPTTLERKAKTTVVIKDGQTIVIGGLIDETDNRTNYRVPFLSRIPLLGNLFKTKTKSLDKKNLYIFLTPHIVENSEEANEIYQNKKGHIDAIREGVIKMHNDGRLSEDMRLVEIGYKHLQLRDYQNALKYYQKALDKNPVNPYAIYNTGYIYQLQGDKQRAIEMYNKLISMDPHERALTSSDPLKAGEKLTDMAEENLKTLNTNE